MCIFLGSDLICLVEQHFLGKLDPLLPPTSNQWSFGVNRPAEQSLGGRGGTPDGKIGYTANLGGLRTLAGQIGNIRMHSKD